MAIDPKEFARMLGAEIVGEVPDVGGGPFGMARLARIMQRLTPSVEPPPKAKVHIRGRKSQRKTR